MKELLGKWTRNRKLELPGQVSLYNLSSVSLKNNQHKSEKQLPVQIYTFMIKFSIDRNFFIFLENMIKR